MEYARCRTGLFRSRPNRFIAIVDIDGTDTVCHVKNTGRCRELLLPGVRVFLAVSDNPARKTRYDLVGGEKQCKSGPLTINMDSQAPNAAVEEWLQGSGLFPAGAVIRREVTHGGSRFDFYVEYDEKRAFLEVKGVTLEQDGVALFPDAPTERGVKHLRELAACVAEGFEAYVLFVVQMKGMRVLRPNDSTHLAFGEALRQAAKTGVTVLAMDCRVTRDSMTIDAPVPVEM